ncbi:hypothetical protein [Herbiconiux liukaitaii]|uniref:hypothetical protein n=1 Tax=Herbiconiux liukaitaii TaxID=3342799 RepID=UPI0035B8518C
MSTSTASIPLTTTRSSRLRIRTRARTNLVTHAEHALHSTGQNADLPTPIIGGYVTARTADQTLEGGYIAPTAYATPTDRIRGSYTGASANIRTTTQGTYITL